MRKHYFYILQTKPYYAIINAELDGELYTGYNDIELANRIVSLLNEQYETRTFEIMCTLGLPLSVASEREE